MGKKFGAARDLASDAVSSSEDMDRVSVHGDWDRKSSLLAKLKPAGDNTGAASDRTESVCCDSCGKWFRCLLSDPNPVCPYCGRTQEREDLLQVTAFGSALAAQQKSTLMDKVREMQQRKETWEDGRKEQISLEMGSAEYIERVEDLKMHDPFRPDDERHVELEEHNEDLVMKNQETPDENPYAEDDGRNVLVEEKLRSEREKRARHSEAVRAAIASAAITETLSDDELARAITTDNELIYDPKVRPKDYVKKLDEYVAEMTL